MEFTDYDTAMKLMNRFRLQLETMKQAIIQYENNINDNEDDGTAMGNTQNIIVALCHEIIETNENIVDFTKKEIQRNKLQ